MTKSRSTKAVLATTLLATLALSACSGPDQAQGDAAAGAGTHAVQSSSAGLPAGNIAAGEKLASTKNAKTGQSCVDCHGADGNAPIDASYPKLGGQYGDYLAHSLQTYRDGRREHALMSSQAVDLTDQQIADLSAYFGSRGGSLKDLRGR